jgi:hypothetical protein
MINYSKGYAIVLARSVDIMLAGWVWRTADVTISSLCGLELRKPAPRKWARILGWILNHLQRNHCELAIQADRERAQQALQILS